MNCNYLNKHCPLLFHVCMHVCVHTYVCVYVRVYVQAHAHTSRLTQHRAIALYSRILFLPKTGMHAHMHMKGLPST